MDSSQIYKPITLRNYIQHCIEGNIIYSIHQREDYSWSLEQCLDYLNNLLQERVSHIIAFCKHYNQGPLRGHKFSSDTNNNIDIVQENLKNVQIFPQETVFSFDGRHKTQLLVWVVNGCKVIFKSNQKEVRFYIQFKINSNNGNINPISPSDIKIICSSTDKKWFLGNNSTELNILFKNIDNLIYPDLIPSHEMQESLRRQIEYNNIKIPTITTDTLATFLFAELHKFSSKCLLYTKSDISNMISFQERNVKDLTDAQISKGIRDSQKGTDWAPLEVFKNHGENILNITGFKKLIKDQTQKFIDLGIQKQNTEPFQKDVVIHSYTIQNKTGLTDAQMEKECDKSTQRITDVIKYFKDITDFTTKVYEKLNTILPSNLIDTGHMKIFTIVFSMMYHSADRNNILNAGDWIINPSTRYFLKLLIKLSFKAYPAKFEKYEISRNLVDIINLCVEKLQSGPPPFDELQYREIENIISEFCKRVPEFDFNKINHQDIKGHESNRDLFYHIVYGPKPKDIDYDHSLSEHESKTYYNERPDLLNERELYDKYYRDSIYNIKYLHFHENRSPIVKGKKTQKEFYIDAGLQGFAEKQHIDIEAIDLDLSPYERMRANKIKFDDVIISRFSLYGFNQEDFNLSLPGLYKKSLDKDTDEISDIICDCD